MHKNPLQNTQTVLLDIDGTLIDSNDAHAKAWVEALAEFDITVSYEKVRSKIGMGGDHLLPLVTGIQEETPKGKKISERRGEIFRKKYLKTLKALPGARQLLQVLKDLNIEMIVATSASKEDLEKLLDQAGIKDLLHKKTSADDAEESKPSPDIIEAALKKTKAKPEHVIMIGDTPYDIQAAKRAGVRTIAFGSGGWSKAELSEAIDFYEGPADFCEVLVAGAKQSV